MKNAGGLQCGFAREPSIERVALFVGQQAQHLPSKQKKVSEIKREFTT